MGFKNTDIKIEALDGFQGLVVGKIEKQV